MFILPGIWHLYSCEFASIFWQISKQVYIIIIDALDAILMMHMRALLYGCDSVILISRLQFIHFRKWYRLKPLFRHMEKIMFIDALNTFLHTGCGNQFTLNVDMTLHLGEEKHHMPLMYSPIPVK